MAVTPEAEVAAPRLRYLPWMDGMRAIAVGAVMVFHEIIAAPTLGMQHVIAGGWLGVDVFFAISGFLITALLLQEVGNLGRIHFGAFYLRRVRRLLPALVTLLVVIAGGALVFQVGRERIATLEHVGIAGAYATNWVVALTGKPLHGLDHTWSLAAEEQFYLLWPALLTGLLLLTRRRPNATVVGIGIVAAFTVLWPQFATHRHWTTARIYYGLDTRAASLGVGALLGALLVLGRLPTGAGWTLVRRVAGALGTIALILIIHDSTVVSRFAHRVGVNAGYGQNGAYAIVGIATSLVIWELIAAGPHLGHRILSWPPLVFMGRISYGLYLWDAVIVVWIEPKHHRGWPLVAFHVLLTFAAATASWFVIERRFRSRRAGPAPSGSLAPGG